VGALARVVRQVRQEHNAGGDADAAIGRTGLAAARGEPAAVSALLLQEPALTSPNTW
jgi:hypothetical protein